MFGSILTELFPTDCLVLEVVPGSQYVYPIFKNGSTSLQKSGFKTVSLEELKQLDTVEVYVRDPHERFVSGVRTYLSTLDPALDKNTALYFIKKYFYLNRHFSPQLLWLLHLRKFTNAKFAIKPITELGKLTSLRENQSPKTDSGIDFLPLSKIRFYNEMDEVLTVNLLNQTVTFEEIIAVLQSNYDNLYHEVFKNLKDIVNVVP